MKEKLCFRKYKKSSIINSLLFLAIILLGIATQGMVGVMVIVFSLVPFFLAIYHTYAYVSYQKKVKALTPSIGTISNWGLSGRRSYWGHVVLKLDGVTYCSPDYFRAYEAEEMVGKEVSYVIVEDTLLIYEVLH